jgi:hypothetical protein
LDACGFLGSRGSHRSQLKECFFEIQGRCTECHWRIGCRFAPKPLEPPTPIQIARKLGGRVWSDDAPTEGGGEMGEALAFNKPVPLEGDNSPISAETGNGSRRVEAVARRTRTDRKTAFPK